MLPFQVQQVKDALNQHVARLASKQDSILATAETCSVVANSINEVKLYYIQHFIFLIVYLLLPIKCIILDSVSKILVFFTVNNNYYDSNIENIAP